MNPTTTTPHPLVDATHLRLVVQFPHSHRAFCHADCPTWINDLGCDCPPYQPLTAHPTR